jgi:nucleoside-diphosphate-sugar epimerase
MRVFVTGATGFIGSGCCLKAIVGPASSRQGGNTDRVVVGALRIVGV